MKIMSALFPLALIASLRVWAVVLTAIAAQEYGEWQTED